LGCAWEDAIAVALTLIPGSHLIDRPPRCAVFFRYNKVMAARHLAKGLGMQES